MMDSGDSVWVAHASRGSGDCVLAIANFPLNVRTHCRVAHNGRLFRRDTETNTRDACATQSTRGDPVFRIMDPASITSNSMSRSRTLIRKSVFTFANGFDFAHHAVCG